MLEQIKKEFHKWLDTIDREGLNVSFDDAGDFINAHAVSFAIDMHFGNKSAEEIGAFMKSVFDYVQDEVHPVFELKQCRAIFNNIQQLPEPRRTIQLSKLMSDMERNFSIPMLNNEVFNAANVEVVSLYREVSNARDL
ncbi:hypothetical protein ACTHOQ_09385 [Solibacillus silvestris]|uniref:hypothetical protein n=1 Tax=Solibacillus silvestris TaxID=76853 RepID=UPI003F7F1C29